LLRSTANALRFRRVSAAETASPSRHSASDCPVRQADALTSALIAGPPWFLALLAAGGSAIAMVALTRLAPYLPVDRPGPRSLHARPVSRLGGLAIWAGFFPVVLLAPPALPGNPEIWLLASGVVAAVSLIDDCRGVHPAYRLASHLAAAVAVAVEIVRGAELSPGIATCLAVGAAAIAMVWAANLYNFMDGSDGLAAAMGACGFGAYGVAAWQAGAPATAYFALAAAILPFLAVNAPPARMFMGDVGAVPLGFLAGAFGLAGWRAGIWPAWFPALVFLPFIADATVTLGRRACRRERVWDAHKMHYYQRLHQLGAGHRGTLLVFGVLIAGTVASALATLAIDPGSGWIVIAAWGSVLAALFWGIEYHWQHHALKPR
jgi:UDP-GlcNAc:undecaprenyl-phosphate/decaprenyl-phosphate GlcNAc-1-phosphate transferase